MNCHYCHYPIDDGSPVVQIAPLSIPGVFRNLGAHLSCAIANVNTVPAHPDKSGKWCDYNHPPTGKWCMLPPHGDDVKHELEAAKR